MPTLFPRVGIFIPPAPSPEASLPHASSQACRGCRGLGALPASPFPAGHKRIPSWRPVLHQPRPVKDGQDVTTFPPGSSSSPAYRSAFKKNKTKQHERPQLDHIPRTESTSDPNSPAAGWNSPAAGAGQRARSVPAGGFGSPSTPSSASPPFSRGKEGKKPPASLPQA